MSLKKWKDLLLFQEDAKIFTQQKITGKTEGNKKKFSI
jgi:hypothetical protein